MVKEKRSGFDLKEEEMGRPREWQKRVLKTKNWASCEPWKEDQIALMGPPIFMGQTRGHLIWAGRPNSCKKKLKKKKKMGNSRMIMHNREFELKSIKISEFLPHL